LEIIANFKIDFMTK